MRTSARTLSAVTETARKVRFAQPGDKFGVYTLLRRDTRNATRSVFSSDGASRARKTERRRLSRLFASSSAIQIFMTSVPPR